MYSTVAIVSVVLAVRKLPREKTDMHTCTYAHTGMHIQQCIFHKCTSFSTDLTNENRQLVPP